MNKKYNVMIIILLLIVIISSILLIKLIKTTKKDDKEILKNITTNTDWPIKDVPVLSREDVKISENFPGSFYVSFDKEVTYPEFRKYLIDLYDAGFKPDITYGSENPNRLYQSIEGSSISDILWVGTKNNDFMIHVYWSKKAISDSEYEHKFYINLYVKSMDEETKYDDIIISGEDILTEEAIKSSGEDILTEETIKSSGEDAVSNE